MTDGGPWDDATINNILHINTPIVDDDSDEVLVRASLMRWPNPSGILTISRGAQVIKDVSSLGNLSSESPTKLEFESEDYTNCHPSDIGLGVKVNGNLLPLTVLFFYSNEDRVWWLSRPYNNISNGSTLTIDGGWGAGTVSSTLMNTGGGAVMIGKAYERFDDPPRICLTNGDTLYITAGTSVGVGADAITANLKVKDLTATGNLAISGNLSLAGSYVLQRYGGNSTVVGSGDCGYFYDDGTVYLGKSDGSKSTNVRGNVIFGSGSTTYLHGTGSSGLSIGGSYYPSIALSYTQGHARDWLMWALYDDDSLRLYHSGDNHGSGADKVYFYSDGSMKANGHIYSGDYFGFTSYHTAIKPNTINGNNLMEFIMPDGSSAGDVSITGNLTVGRISGGLSVTGIIGLSGDLTGNCYIQYGSGNWAMRIAKTAGWSGGSVCSIQEWNGSSWILATLCTSVVSQDFMKSASSGYIDTFHDIRPYYNNSTSLGGGSNKWLGGVFGTVYTNAHPGGWDHIDDFALLRNIKLTTLDGKTVIDPNSLQPLYAKVDAKDPIRKDPGIVDCIELSDYIGFVLCSMQKMVRKHDEEDKNNLEMLNRVDHSEQRIIDLMDQIAALQSQVDALNAKGGVSA
jgi:hypothetical protein